MDILRRLREINDHQPTLSERDTLLTEYAGLQALARRAGLHSWGLAHNASIKDIREAIAELKKEMGIKE